MTHYAWNIPSDVAEVDSICQAARKRLESQGQTASVFAVDLLLREFLNNAIFHGNRSDIHKRVQVGMRIGRKWLILWIGDEGTGFDWRMMRRDPPGGSAATGRGLLIGTQYAQRMRFNRVGNRVILWIGKTAKKEIKMDTKAPEIERDGGVTRVTLQEKLTAADVPALQPALKQELADGVREIIFDLTRTVSLDSTGIGLLIATNNSMAQIQGTIRLINVSADILKLLQSMRLVDRLHATAAGKEDLHG
jgi:anti-sigma B factor antagonist